jgi:hypothetical protein
LRQLQTNHDDEDADKDGHEVGEEGESVLDVVHVTVVSHLDDLLRIVHHVPKEDQQAKVNLQHTSQMSHCLVTKLQPGKTDLRQRKHASHLRHEAASGMAKDGCGKLQPEQDGEARREQTTEVEVLPALGHDSSTRETRERNGSSNKSCHKNAGNTKATSVNRRIYARQFMFLMSLEQFMGSFQNIA